MPGQDSPFGPPTHYWQESTRTSLELQVAVGVDGLQEGTTRSPVDEEVIAHVTTEFPDVDPDLIRTSLQGIADLHRDAEGSCQSVSAAFLAESRTD